MSLNEKKILAVVSDFDGTIIKKGSHVPPAGFYKLVDKLVDKGIPFVAASGRQYANLRRILSPVADRIHYIAENGCLVVWQGEVIFKSSFPRELSHELIHDMLTVEGVDIMASGEGTCYILPDDPVFVDRICNKVQYDTELISDFYRVEEDYIKISMHFKNEKISKSVKTIFLEKYGDRLQIVDGGDAWLDFNMKGTGKGPALKLLSTKLGIPTENMIAFGDSENDISMLQTAGISYAMSTALPHVKIHADRECENVETVLQDYFQ